MMSCHWIMNKALLILTVFLLAACAEKSENQKFLDQVMTLYLESETEMAEKFFLNHSEKIKPPVSESDSMYILLIQEFVKGANIDDVYQIHAKMSDTVATNSLIDYYTKSGDKEKLAISLLIKCQKMFLIGMPNEGVYYLKEAENVILPLNNNKLRFVLETTRLSYLTNNLDLKSGMMLADTLMKYSENQREINSTYLYKAIFYSFAQCPDSAKLTIRKCTPDTTDYYYLSYYAWICADEEPERCDSMARKAVADKPKSPAVDYAKLAIVKLLLNRGMADEAETFVKQNPPFASFAQVLCAEDFFRYYKQVGEFEKATNYGAQIIFAKNLIINYINDYKVLQNIQQFDFERQQLENHNYIQRIIIVFVIIMAVLALLIYRQKRRHENELAVNRQILKESRDRIEELKAVTSSDNTKEINRLQAKISEIENRYAELYREGKQLYEQIFVNNGNSGQWNKKDYEKFLEYYKTVDLSLLAQIEGEYPGINPRQTFYKLLAAKDYDKPSIMKIMAIQEDVTFRALKSKVEGMRKK